MKLDFSPIKKFKINNKVEELPDYVDDFVEKVKNSTLMKAEKLQTMVMLILQNEYSQKVAKHKFLEVKTEELNLFKTFEESKLINFR